LYANPRFVFFLEENPPGFPRESGGIPAVTHLAYPVRYTVVSTVRESIDDGPKRSRDSQRLRIQTDGLTLASYCGPHLA